LEEATAECLRAIEIDPDFGNPYNDIGVLGEFIVRRGDPKGQQAPAIVLVDIDPVSRRGYTFGLIGPHLD
jgi:hypothetical protein